MLPIQLFSVLLKSTRAADNDFNCPEQCGLYSSKDKIGPNLHSSCTAMDAKKCDEEFEGGVDYQLQQENKEAEEVQTKFRIVGGNRYKNPMPWMVTKASYQSFLVSCLGTCICFWRVMFWHLDQLSVCTDCCTLLLQTSRRQLQS